MAKSILPIVAPPQSHAEETPASAESQAPSHDNSAPANADEPDLEQGRRVHFAPVGTDLPLHSIPLTPIGERPIQYQQLTCFCQDSEDEIWFRVFGHPVQKSLHGMVFFAMLTTATFSAMFVVLLQFFIDTI
jgi:hypothetical protein